MKQVPSNLQKRYSCKSEFSNFLFFLLVIVSNAVRCEIFHFGLNLAICRLLSLILENKVFVIIIPDLILEVQSFYFLILFLSVIWYFFCLITDYWVNVVLLWVFMGSNLLESLDFCFIAFGDLKGLIESNIDLLVLQTKLWF